MFTFTPNILPNFVLANPGTLGTSLQVLYDMFTYTTSKYAYAPHA